MSGGLAGVSDADLLASLGMGTPKAAATSLEGVSDADLMASLGVKPKAAEASLDERFKAAPPMARADEAPKARQLGLSDLVRGEKGGLETNQDALNKLQAGLRGKADEMLVGKPDLGNQAAAAVIPYGNAFGLNIPKAGGAAVATIAGKLGLGPDRSYAQNYELAGEQEAALGRQFPKTSVAGTVGGIGAGAVTLPAFQAAKGATWVGRTGAAALTGATYGTAGSILDAKDAGDVGKGTVIGGVAAAVLSPVAEKALNALAPFFAKGVSTRNSAGQFTDEARALLSREGINPDTIDHKMERSLIAAFEKSGVNEAALNEGRAAAQGISLTKGQATGDYAQQQAEALAARNGENAGQKVLAERLNGQQEQIAARQKAIGDELAGGQSVVESPYQAGEMVAARARDEAAKAAAAASEAEGGANAALTTLRSPTDPLAAGDAVANRARQVTDEATRAEQTAQQSGERALAAARGEGDAITAADQVAQGVRRRADEGRQGYQQRYDEVANTEGNFQPGSLDQMGASIRNRLGPEYPIDPVVTPSASRALADLDNLKVQALNADGSLSGRANKAIREAGLNPSEVQTAITARGTTEANARAVLDELNVNLPRGLIARHDPEGATLRELDQVRKRLVSYYKSAANNPEDQRAVRQILSQFDDHAERAMQAGLFSGDEGALGRLQGARSAFRDYQQTFRPQGQGDDVGAAMRRIVERDARPDEVAGLLYGNVQSGNVGRSLRLADRLERTLGPDSAEFAAMRRGLVSEIANGRNMAPEAISARIEQALTGDGRQLTQRLLTPEQTAGLRAYQRAVDQAAQARTSPPAWVNELAAANFDPQKVAERLYGSAVTGRSSSSQYADGLRQFFGPNSPEWTAIGQGYVSHILGSVDAGAEALGKRVSAALAPENRMFLQKMLTPEQISGLKSVQQGLSTAKLTRESVPEWISDLAKSDFDPRRVVERMLGSTAPGSNAAAAQYTSGLKKFLGESSPEWAAIRQAAWQQLISKGENAIGDFGAQAQGNRIAQFLDVKGKTLANVLFSPKEQAMMREYAAVQQMLVPKRLAGGSASPNSDTAPAAASALRRLSAKGNAIAGTLAAGGLATGGVVRAALGWGFGKGLAKAADKLQSRAETRFAQDAIAGAPALPPPPRPLDTRANVPTAVGAGLLTVQ